MLGLPAAGTGDEAIAPFQKVLPWDTYGCFI